MNEISAYYPIQPTVLTCPCGAQFATKARNRFKCDACRAVAAVATEDRRKVRRAARSRKRTSGHRAGEVSGNAAADSRRLDSRA